MNDGDDRLWPEFAKTLTVVVFLLGALGSRTVPGEPCGMGAMGALYFLALPLSIPAALLVISDARAGCRASAKRATRTLLFSRALLGVWGMCLLVMNLRRS